MSAPRRCHFSQRCICTSPDASYGCLAATKWLSDSSFSGEVGHAKVAVVDDRCAGRRERFWLLLVPDRRLLLLESLLGQLLPVRGLQAAIAVRLSQGCTPSLPTRGCDSSAAAGPCV